MPDSPRRRTLSVCMIVREEEHRVRQALESASFADEIVVVDGGSRDGTAAVCRAAGARVIEAGWPGFAAQRNRALDLATGDWVLELDADERISGTLREELIAFLEDPPEVDVALTPRLDFLGGRPIGPAARFPAYLARLVRRGTLRHDESRSVHEGLEPRGPVHVFTGAIEHRRDPSLRRALARARRYAPLEAAQRPRAQGTSGWLAAIAVRPLVKLVSRMTVYGGWRDGAPGLAYVATDCAYDLLVAAHQARQALRGVPPAAPRPRPRPPGVVALAGPRTAAAVARELARLRTAGWRVGAVATAAVELPGWVSVTRIAGWRPEAIVRAIDTQRQIGGCDALLVPGLPAALRGRRIGVRLGTVAADLTGPAATRGRRA